MATVEQIKNSSVVTKTTLIIDSKFRTSGEINNFTYDLGTTLENVQLIEIRNIAFTNILENINENNNKLNWVDNLGVTHFDVIEPGNYNTTRLSTAIGEAMTNSTTSSDYYPVNIDFNSAKYTISNSAGITFDLKFGISADESIGPAIGFGITNYLGITTLEGAKQFSLVPAKSLFIGSTVIASNSADVIELSNGVSNICYEFYLTDTFGNIVNNGNEIRSIKSSSPYTLSTLDFTISDDNGDEILIPATANEDAEGGIFKIVLDVYTGIFNLSYYD